jgi:hypothetical protein
MTTARTARESLARALNALQADPRTPPQIQQLAAPVAQAMGALHTIETTGQLAPHAETALNLVRQALGGIQQQPASHAAVAQATEAIAASLGSVHALWQMAQPRAVPAGQPVAQAAQQAAFAPTAVAPAVARPPQPAPQQVSFPQPTAQAAPQPAMQKSNSRMPGAPPAAADMQVINADLGAHSPTNFYKGLSGNDIIDHGGLFVSTYMIPKLGTNVRLKVSLPGGYEFEANAVVSWTREASDAGDGAPPGFGAKFTAITAEARQLVYRYVRNREPLFHDDL